ncbi:MAG: CBS domain-containing protein [Armatimonadetes bacterium]|nr:CBS domain-containing protein [Armatimonadota bacterium]
MELVRDIMQPDVICVPENMTVRELCSVLAHNRIAGAPVVDAQDYLVGVVSLADVARFVAGLPASEASVLPLLEPCGQDYWNSGPSHRPEIRTDDIAETTRVKDIMNQRVYRVNNQASIKEVVDLMISEGIHRVIVTHRDHVIGIVTSLDLMRVFSRRLEEE